MPNPTNEQSPVIPGVTDVSYEFPPTPLLPGEQLGAQGGVASQTPVEATQTTPDMPPVFQLDQPTPLAAPQVQPEAFLQAPLPFAPGVPVSQIPPQGPAMAPTDAGLTGDIFPQLQITQQPPQQPWVGLPGGIKSGFEKGFGKQARALEQLAKAQQTLAEGELLKLEQLRGDLDLRDSEIYVKEQKRAQKLKDLASQVDTSANELANFSFDNDFWGRKTTGQKIGLGIALVMSTIGGGLMGTGKNSAANMIMKHIDNDMRQQQIQYNAKLRGVGAKRNALTSMMAIFRDERTADAAARAAMINRAQYDLAGAKAKYASEGAKAKAEGAIGELEVEKQKIISSLMKAKGQSSILARTGRIPKNIPSHLLPQKLQDYWVPGYGKALTKKAAEEANKAVANIGTVNENLDALIDVMDGDDVGDIWESTTGFWDPERKASISSAVSTLIGTMKTDIVGPGAISEAEWKLIREVIPNPSVFSNVRLIRAQLRNLKEKVNASHDRLLRSKGFQTEGTRKKQIGIQQGAAK